MSRPILKQLLLMRHAESVANVRGVLAGRIDPTPLSTKGRREAKLLQHVIQGFAPDLCISSPMLRCRQTAMLATDGEIELDERLIEMDYGSWSGKRLQLLAKRPDWKRIQKDPENFTFPGGESFEAARSRLRSLISDLLSGRTTKIAIFTHGDITRILINDLLNRDLNDFQKIMIEPSSHSMISIPKGDPLSQEGATVHYINRRESAGRSPTKGFVLGGEA